MRRFLLLLLIFAAPAQASPWSEAAGPTPGPPRAIGGFADGCIAGARSLPLDGPGYSVIRISRRRYFGHPTTLQFVERLGRAARGAGLAPFYVGDMAQPRGGPLPFGHASHQTGLDVDIWFNLDPKSPLIPAAREEVPLPSMLGADGAVDPERFGTPQVRLLRLAAGDPAVDRLFVNPAIKLALCRGIAGSGEGDRSWLRRVRPWYGHDDHFHVRLHCPADSPECRPQAPPPEGDGCDALGWWLAPQRAPSPQPAPSPAPAPARHPPLPLQCRAVLSVK